MNILLVTLLLVLVTAAVGVISGAGAGFAFVLFLAAVVAGLVLNGCRRGLGRNPSHQPGEPAMKSVVVPLSLLLATVTAAIAMSVYGFTLTAL